MQKKRKKKGFSSLASNNVLETWPIEQEIVTVYDFCLTRLIFRESLTDNNFYKNRISIEIF